MAETRYDPTRSIDKFVCSGVAVVIVYPLHCKHPPRVTMLANIHRCEPSVGESRRRSAT